MADNKTRWFQGDQRIESILEDYSLLRSAGSEKRCQLKLAIQLFENDNLVGAPGWMLDARSFLIKSGQPDKRTTYDKDSTISGMTVEMFSTEKIKRRFFPPLVGCTIRPLSLERNGKDDEKNVTLHCVIYAAATKEIHDWVYEYAKGTFWAAFELVQSELNLDGNDDSDIPDFDEDDEEEEDE